MHDGSDEPSEECATCGTELWIGYLSVCCVCQTAKFCEYCAKGAKGCRYDETADIVCDTCYSATAPASD
jgi:hypothetical protein